VTVGIVTGAAGGIGAAISERLAAEVDHLVLVDLAPELAHASEEIADAGTRVSPVQVDLTSDDGLAAVIAALGGDPVTMVVNNAGITRDARLVNMTEADFAAVLAVNLGAPHRLVQALAGRFAEGAGIVNIASRAYLGNFGQFNYSMSKGGIVGLTRALAIELAPRVHVNAVAPGLIATEMAMGIPDDVRMPMIEAIPMKRMGEPSEVAELVAFLASARASYITGHVHVIGGGRSLT
jgi:NAD(P)-dependent dehydrogenase (short-subunit alcohol dehydrogenase family)